MSKYEHDGLAILYTVIVTRVNNKYIMSQNLAIVNEIIDFPSC